MEKFWTYDNIVSIQFVRKFSRRLSIIKYIEPGTVLRKKSWFRKEKVAGNNIYTIEDYFVYGLEKYCSLEDIKEYVFGDLEKYYNESWEKRYEINPNDNEIYFKPYIHLRNTNKEDHYIRFNSDEELNNWCKEHPILMDGKVIKL